MLLCSSKQNAHCNHLTNVARTSMLRECLHMQSIHIVTFQHRCKSLHPGVSSAGDNPPTTQHFFVSAYLSRHQVHTDETNHRAMTAAHHRKKHGRRPTETFNQRSKSTEQIDDKSNKKQATTKNGNGKKTKHSKHLRKNHRCSYDQQLDDHRKKQSHHQNEEAVTEVITPAWQTHRHPAQSQQRIRPHPSG